MKDLNVELRPDETYGIHTLNMEHTGIYHVLCNRHT